MGTQINYVIKDSETNKYYTGRSWGRDYEFSREINDAKRYDSNDKITLDLSEHNESDEPLFVTLGVKIWIIETIIVNEEE